MLKNFPYFRQLDQMDCGPTCLRMIAKHFGRHYSAQTLREKSQIGRVGVSMLGIAEAAEAIGLRSVGVKISLDKLAKEAPLPCVLHWGQNHFVVLYAISGRKSVVDKQELSEAYGGRASPAGEFIFEGTILPHSELVTREPEPVDRRTGAGNGQDGVRTKTFFIADPARGLVSYSGEEFSSHWISSNLNGTGEGLALLLDPTPRFYDQDGEKGDAMRLSRLIGYLWGYKKFIWQLFLGTLMGSVLSLVFPFLTQSIVDVGIGAQNLPFIYLALVGQLVLLVSTTAVDFLRSWILLHISTRLNLTILSEFLSKMMRLPLSFFDVKQFGDIMQRIGDHHRIESFLTGQTLSIFFSLFNLLVFGLLLAYYHLSVFLVAVVASVVYALWVLLFLGKRRKMDTQRFEISSRNQSQIVQLIQGMQDIKLSGAETTKRWEWERTQARLFKWSVKGLSLSQIQQGGALLINQSKNIVVTFLSAKAVVDGDLTLGGMMSIQYIMGQFNAPVEQMIGFLQAWQDAQISLERLNEVHGLTDEEPFNEPKRHDWRANASIKLTDLTYTYPGAGNDPVLNNVNLTIPGGKTTAIVGSSGSGKTTLLKLLLRFYEPQVGRISLGENFQPGISFSNLLGHDQERVPNNGEIDLKFISHRAWRQQCGVVMQDGFIFSDTIARNIAVVDEVIDQQRLYDAARIANIHNYIDSLPLGYHTKIGAEGNGISQGQKQRILIARAVYKNPQLLLFDEATNALDSSNEAVIIKNMEKFFENRTVVIVAHRLSTVRHANQIVVLEKGEIVEIGTHAELIQTKGRYFDLISNQLELTVG